MANARDAIELILEDNPSFARRVEVAMAWAYPRAVRNAAAQTGLPETTFPREAPRTFKQVMDVEEWRGE